MATNYIHIISDSSERSESSSQSMRNHESAQSCDRPTQGEGAAERRSSPVQSDHIRSAPIYRRPRPFRDAHLIRNRKICFNQNDRRELELRCEEKTSKYKLEEVHSSLPSSIKSTFIMTFSPDGQRVASTHGDHRIYICDLNTGRLLDTLDGHPKTPWCLAWHPSNREILASGCLAGEVRVWDLKSKACESWVNRSSTIVTSLDFHPRDRVLAIATANEVLFWDWSESEPFAKTTTMHEKEKVKFVEFDSTGMKLITGISNLPKYAGYSSSDSLQSRIIDGYLTPRSIEISAENVTTNSENATNPTNSSTNTNDTSGRVISDHDYNSSPVDRRLNVNNAAGTNRSLNTSDVNVIGGPIINNEQDISQRNTVLLARIAMLYRQLESLETSMRQTSFTPFVNPLAAPECLEYSSNNRSEASPSNDSLRRSRIDSELATEQSAPASSTANTTRQSQADQSSSSQMTSNTNPFEPLLFLFDECLMSLQIPPLTIDGQSINMANVIEQYPVSVDHQLNYAMQLEIINQVNQNFIRISKLMSSARLYRKIVRQIVSSNPGDIQMNPNQRLTVQSISSRAPRNSQNLPLMLQNIHMGNLFDSNSIQAARTNSPIALSVHFRNSATDVPLANICKIDLLAARTVCIMRAQALVENSLASCRLASSMRVEPQTSSATSANNAHSESLGGANRSNSQIPGEFNQILSNLHSILTQINHAPLTTSNAYTHITSLRMTLERLLKALASALHSSDPIRRSIHLIPSIAFNLTNRKRSMPLGATMNEIRLDVVHALCFVDMTLHLVRQVQLLQMQRIPVLFRIEESRRLGEQRISENLNNERPIVLDPLPTQSPVAGNADTPCASSSTTSTASGSQSSGSKRRGSSEHGDIKKRKLATGNGPANASDTSGSGGSAIEELDTEAARRAFGGNNMEGNDASEAFAATTGRSTDIPNLFPDIPSSEEDLMMRVSGRLFLWNNHPVNRSLQRFVVTNPEPNVNAPSHMAPIDLVRLHQLYGDTIIPIQSVGWNREHSLIDGSSIQRSSNHVHHESRRRALSQDHAADIQDSPPFVTSNASNSSSSNVNTPRVRVRAPAAIHVNLGQGGQQNQHHHHHHLYHRHPQIPPGLVIDPWQRHAHLHIYQHRGPGQHLWYNQWGAVPLPFNNSNYRLQCWSFTTDAIPRIKDPQCNLITTKCRIHNDSSVDISKDGHLIACLVPRDELSSCLPNFDLKIFSLKTHDFGTCYYKLPHGFNAVSVSLSPSARHAVVGLTSQKIINANSDEDDVIIAKIYKLAQGGSHEFIRDVKIKRDDSASSLNAIRWMSRGIVYNVGPQHHQRYRVRNMMAP